MAVDSYARQVAIAALMKKGSSSGSSIDAYTKAEANKKFLAIEDAGYYYKNLTKEINPENENQTIVNIKAENGSYSPVLNVDNIDIKNEVPQTDVLGLQKGRDLNERVKSLEKTPINIIKLSSTMTKSDKESHIYPDLSLNSEQIQAILQKDISILKVEYTISDATNNEVDTLVFYTTIDNINIVSGSNIVNTIKINAVRTNDEGSIIYHSELVGNGETYYPSIQLTATYIKY